MSLGSAIVMLGSAGVGREPFRSLPAVGSLIRCGVRTSMRCASVPARPAPILLERVDTEYGSRDFTVRDPERNLWAFGTYRPRVGED